MVVATRLSETEEEMAVLIGRAYYGGARTIKGLLQWLHRNDEIKALRWCRRNSALAEKWLMDGAGNDNE